jgi:hypothetical protein
MDFKKRAKGAVVVVVMVVVEAFDEAPFGLP